MRFFSFVFLFTAGEFCFATTGASLAIDRRDIYTTFSSAQWSANTTISQPSSRNFTASTERWSVFDPPTFSVAISPATERDVAQAVRLAINNSISFLATGGRHGYTQTLKALQNGLAIDLSQLDEVKIDKSAATLTIGGAVRFGDIYNPVYNAGFELQIGTASCPGMVGVTLGAGIGPWSGVHGLVLDALLSLRVVTASSEIIEVSETSNSDLFWAFRGAGANFGIVISATYRLQPQINEGQILAADLIIPAEQNSSYFQLLQAYNESLPRNLSLSSFMTYNATISAPQISASWVWIGEEAAGYEAFAPVLALKDVISNIQVYQWNEIVENVAGGANTYECLDGAFHSVYNANARNISASTYETVFKKFSGFCEQYPDGRGSVVEIVFFPNQAVLAVPDSATAYPWRDSKAYL
ncbi:FAD-linked oxidoreductase azaL [Lachnellula suecica]|uniref:FAD-linked oxidoreductase azaL n=1 Tax=Lachnellula suecica TaxID=602035 RepID=A0A8T9CEA5_9HELO|nr:FAD-linked oxidoreductase azaL [Lachnellula suecica]